MMWSTTFSTSLGLTKWVMPNLRAMASRAGLRSTPMILSAPTIFAPWMTFRPMPPSPNTTTLAPASTFAVNTTAPIPVVTPQPI
ncbi:Uncharacterised protein [Bordetella pertussis]|nr:Uncharacterised protein [Bordetella pertussis]CPK69328.1 Uncharacterised protein [Bordetella pertussis]